jgi:hypothetical protein
MCLYAIITFRSTHFALKAKRVLDRQGVRDYILTAVPREFSAQCGFCLKAPWDRQESLVQILQQNCVEFSAIHRLDRRNRQNGATFV